jgi:hypothetical protein
MAVAAGLIAAGAFAIVAGATPAYAAPSPWTKMWIVSQRNMQCAWPSADNHLAPIDSDTCTVDMWWYCRVLNYDGNSSDWSSTGYEYECVDQSYSYMFGESGGAFKLETPNANDFMLSGQSTGSYFMQLEYTPNDNYFGSGPAGSALGVETTEPSGYGWYFEFAG